MSSYALDIRPEWQHPHDYYDPKNALLLSHIDGHHLNQGIGKMEDGHYKAAEHDFEFMLRSFPNHPVALLRMGEVALKQQRPDLAIHYFEKAIAIYPKTPSNYLVYGIFLHQQDRFYEAIEKYKISLELDPKLTEAHYNLGLAYVAVENFEAALNQAKIAYQQGYPLPGLRQKLIDAKVWPHE
jgi:tetratricopeptide (TPR) repeat protein